MVTTTIAEADAWIVETNATYGALDVALRDITGQIVPSSQAGRLGLEVIVDRQYVQPLRERLEERGYEMWAEPWTDGHGR